MQFTSCDMCGSTTTETLIPYHRWQQPVPEGLELVRCCSCGLVYLNPRPSAQEISDYYPENYMSFHKAVEEERFFLMRWMRKRKLSNRRKLLENLSGNQGGTILDVGCGTGLFLNEMKRSGWDASGIEPAHSAAQYARAKFRLTVEEGFLEDTKLTDESFDWITFWDVLEHTYSPSSSLAAAYRLLKPGGWIAINVPNWKNPGRGIFGPHWIGYDPPRHLYVFTRETLYRLLSNSGFVLERWACIMPGYFASILSVRSYLHARSPSMETIAWRFLNIPGMRLLFEPYFSLLNFLKLGPTITLFARKGTS